MPSQSKLTASVVLGVGAYGASQAFTSAPTPTGTTLPRGAVAARQSLAGASLGQSSTSLWSTACTITGLSLAAGAARDSKRHGKVRVMATSKDEELEFQPGQKVVLLGPPALAGKPGTIVGPALGNSFAVRFNSGSVFNIAMGNLQDASGPAAVATPTSPVTRAATSAARKDEEELEFQPGQKVILLGPPAMAGKQGTIVGPALGNAFSVRFDSGSIFSIATGNIQDAHGPGAAPAVSKPAAVAAPTPAPSMAKGQTQDEELEFENGQRVKIVAPAALAGKQGMIGGPVRGMSDCFMVVLDSGSVFNIRTENLKALVMARA